MAKINNEYDVQDLLRGILAGLFDDVRNEESTPSHAGLTSRTDPLLKNEQIIIETKMTGPTSASARSPTNWPLTRSCTARTPTAAHSCSSSTTPATTWTGPSP